MLGLLCEKWKKYKVIIIGIALICVGFVFITVGSVSLYLKQLNSITTVIISISVTCPFFLGYGLFEANVIQFSTDQLLFSPSKNKSESKIDNVFIYKTPVIIDITNSSKASVK